MATTLLRTKLYRPARKDNLVKRSQLISRLDSGSKRKLTLVSAPAGFGKTTLVSEWIDKTSKPCAWLSLDNDDNELQRFLIYLVNAIKQIDNSVGDEVLKVLNATKTEPEKDLLIKFADELGDINDNFTLVLDDYHVIINESIHDTVDFIIDYMPDNMHLVMITRSDPPLPLARLRVRSEITEVRAADLRFSEAETKSFFNDLMDLNLSEDEVAALENRTEGWIASLQLAGLSMQGIKDKKKFISAFSGSHRFIIDYLVDEVLSRQTKEVQEFLLKTSILKRLSAPLCNELLTITNSQEILDELEKNNLFLVSLDNEREWYRYHHLFGDFLNQRLKEKEPEALNPLHKRAAAWLGSNEQTMEAIAHAIEGEDLKMAADIIEPIAQGMIIDSQVLPLLNWKSKLSEDIISKRPWISTAFAWSCILAGMNQEDVEPLLDLAETAINEDKSGDDIDLELLGYVTAARAFMAIGKGKLDDLIKDSIKMKAMKQIPDDNIFLQAALNLNLGSAYYVHGEFEDAKKYLVDGSKLSMESKSYSSALLGKSYLGYMQITEGFFQESIQTFNKVIEIGTEAGGGQPIPSTGYGYMGLGQVFYEWNNLSDAEINIKRGIELGDKINNLTTGIRGNLALVKLKQAQKDFDLAEAALNLAMEMAPRGIRVPEGLQISAWEMELKLAKGVTIDTAAWADVRSEQLGETLEYIDLRLDIALAKIRIDQERPADALNVLKKLLKDAREAGRRGDAIEILTLVAIAEMQSENTDVAMSEFKNALDLGEPKRYVRTFIDQGKAVEGLLKKAISEEIKVDYASMLLKSLIADSKISKSSRAKAAKEQPLVDPLSERELEVLALVAERLQYQEIADRLVVSLNTIRTHSKSIYSKLGVNSAAQAADKARELGLIKKD